MLFRSTRRVAAGAAVALAAGALSVPAFMAPAHAAPTSVLVPQAMGCAYQAFNIEYLAAADVTVDGTAVTVRASRMQPTGIPAAFKVHSITATWSVVLDGETVSVTGNRVFPTPLTNNPSIQMPAALTGTRIGTGAVSEASLGTLTVTLGLETGFGPPGTISNGVFNCAPKEMPADTALFACTTFGSPFAYPTKVGVTAAQSGANVGVRAALDAMPGVVPLPLSDVPVTSSLTATVNGAAAELTGSHTVASIPTYNPIPVPVSSASVASSATSVALQIQSAHFTATAMGTAVEIPCVLEAPFTAATAGVTPEPPVVTPPVVTPPVVTPPVVTPPVVKVASKTKVSVKYANKVATIKVKITGGKAPATGKVSILVKKGKKTVKKISATVKNGVATAKVKKLKKGKHTVTAKYAGDSALLASQGKVSFTVK